MKKIWIVNVMNRFENDKITPHYFTTEEKAMAYALRINTEYEKAREAKRYGLMVEHVDLKWGIKAVDADEE